MSSSLPLIEAIHASGVRLSLSVSGAGSLAAAQLTHVAGCSRTLIGAETLYAPPTLSAALDYTPSSSVTARVARQLAQHAYVTGQRLDRSGGGADGKLAAPLFGVGATSAVQTSRPRHGRDCAYVCVWGGASREACRAITYTVDLPSHQSRLEQDAAVASLVIHAIAQATQSVTPRHVEGVPGSAEQSAAEHGLVKTITLGETCVAHAEKGGVPTDVCASPVSLAHAVVSGEIDAVIWNRHGEVRVQQQQQADSQARESHPLVELYGSEGSAGGITRPYPGCPSLSSGGCLQLLYPGSFRPLHWGHTELARAASAVVQRTFQQYGAKAATTTALLPEPGVIVTYELAAAVVDKGSVSAESLAQRVRQFLERGERIAITPARLFTEKARLFPGHGFIVGVDTAERILDPQYYEGGDEAGMIRALLRDIDAHGCYFVVGGRLASASSQLSAEEKQTARWVSLESLSVPEPIRHLFIDVPEKDFRVDVSSTELRARMGIA